MSVAALRAKPRGKPREEPQPATWGPFDDYRCAHHTFRRVLGRILGPFELAVSDYTALRLASAEPVRPSFLSAHLGVSPAATTEVLDRLEARGLVRRERDPTDRRAVAVSLTENGAKLYRRASQAHRAFLDSLARDMRPHELEALRSGSLELRRVLEERSRELDLGEKET